MSSNRETRLKKLKIRSWRRGMKEMDLILGGFADAGLADLTDAKLDLYEALLVEPDQQLYKWFSGQELPPPEFADLVQEILEQRRAAPKKAP